MWMILSRGRKPKREYLLEGLAEEDTQILALAYAHAKYLTVYGVDIEKAMHIATENAEIATRAYQKGYYDAMEKANTAFDTKGSLDKIASELEDLIKTIDDMGCSTKQFRIALGIVNQYRKEKE